MIKLSNRVFKKIKRLSKLVAIYHKLPYSNYTLEDSASDVYKNLYRVEILEDIEGKPKVITKPSNKSYRLHMSQKGLKQHMVYLYTSGLMSEHAIDILIEQNLMVKR